MNHPLTPIIIINKNNKFALKKIIESINTKIIWIWSQ